MIPDPQPTVIVPAPAEVVDEPRPMARLRNYFLTGLVVAGPVAITAYLTWSFVTWVDDLVRPFIPVVYRPETYLNVYIPGYGLIIAFVVVIAAFVWWINGWNPFT